MGFSFKKLFSNKRMGGLLVGVSSGGMLPGFEMAMATDKGVDISQEVHKGLGNLVSGGYVQQKKATEEQKKARDQARDQFAAEQAAAEATARKIAEAEEERKRRLAAQGTQTPSTLLNTYLGISSGARVRRPLLG